MNDTKQKYQKYDWEGIIFPLTLTRIQSVTHHYDISFDSELSIWRNDEYRLIGLIKGVVDDKNALEYKEHGEIKKVGFINGETLRAESNNEHFLIEGFGLENINMFAVHGDEKLRIGFSCEVYLEKISVITDLMTKPEIICEWYLCSMPDVLFAHTTSRYDSHPNYKVRNTVDDSIENKSEYLRNGYSSFVNKVRFGLGLLTTPTKIHRFIYSTSSSSLFDTEFKEIDYNPSGMIGSKSEFDLLKDSIEYCFDQKFVPYIKTKLIEEGVL
jgi:hypothetical protein